MKKMFFTAVALFAISTGTIANESTINPQSFEKIAFNYKKLPQRDITAIHDMCVNVAIDTLDSIDPNFQLSQSSMDYVFQLSYSTCVFTMI